MNIQPYVFFDGRCDEAIAFYRTAINAEVTSLMRYGQAPVKPPEGALPPNSDDKIMHCAIRIGDSEIFVSDGCQFTNKPQFEGMSLVLNAASDTEAQHLFSALSKGGTVTMPLGKSFFASSFGMLKDPFGVAWIIIAGNK